MSYCDLISVKLCRKANKNTLNQSINQSAWNNIPQSVLSDVLELTQKCLMYSKHHQSMATHSR
jgi:hypothetical protein